MTNPFTAILGSLVQPVTDLISEAIVDKDKAAEIAYKVSTLAATQAHEQVMGQLAVNKAEAESGSLWNGGWRPFVGWTCGSSLAINFIAIPMFGPVIEAYTPIVMNPLDVSTMIPILLGMLGLTAARTVEKTQGVARP